MARWPPSSSASLSARLRADGQRYTENRRQLVDLLAAAGQPLTIPEVLSAGVRSSPSRACTATWPCWSGPGVVRRIVTTDDWAHYELAEDLTEHHHHLICSACGLVRDFTVSPPPRALDRRRARKVADGAGFRARPPPARSGGRLPGLRLTGEPPAERRPPTSRPPVPPAAAPPGHTMACPAGARCSTATTPGGAPGAPVVAVAARVDGRRRSAVVHAYDALAAAVPLPRHRPPGSRTGAAQRAAVHPRSGRPTTPPPSCGRSASTGSSPSATRWVVPSRCCSPGVTPSWSPAWCWRRRRSTSASRRQRAQWRTHAAARIHRPVADRVRRLTNRFLAREVGNAPELDQWVPWIIAETRRGDPAAIAEAGRALAHFDARSWAGALAVPAAAVVTTADRLVAPEHAAGSGRAGGAGRRRAGGRSPGVLVTPRRVRDGHPVRRRRCGPAAAPDEPPSRPRSDEHAEAAPPVAPAVSR